MATLREVIAILPYRLRTRFDSLGNFVSAIVEQQEESRLPAKRLSPAELQALQLAIFIHSLDHFFQEGTRAAALAVDELADLGISGFRIGTSLFEGRNDNVMRGQQLSNALREVLHDFPSLEIDRRFRGIKPLTLHLMEKVRNARTLD